jgi:hypothetical protein
VANAAYVTGLVTLELNAFIVIVSLMIIAVMVAGFMVFANFLNREKERAKRFRERRGESVSQPPPDERTP